MGDNLYMVRAQPEKCAVLGCTLAGVLLAACSAAVPGRDRPPVAVAGADRRVPVGKTITLDGSQSFDPDGDTISDYAWQLLVAPPGSRVQLAGADSAAAELTPDREGLYLVALVVGAGSLVSSPDLVRVVAGPADTCDTDDDCGPCRACQPDGSCREDLTRNQDCPPCYDCRSGLGCQPVAAGSDPRGDCDDGLFCNGLESCDGQGSCQPGTPPCPPQLDCDENGDSCNGCTADGDCPVCQKCSSEGACIEQANGEDRKDECPDGPCLTGFCDGAGSCGKLAPASPCDDGDPCNGSDFCDDAGACSQHSGSPCPETPCNTCQPGGSCFDPFGTPCSLGAACAGDGACNGSGTCQAKLDDDYCRVQDPQSICLPACSTAPSGCLVPPGQAALVCNPRRLAPGETSDCTLTLSGGDTVGQEACLQCRVDSAPLLLAEADFTDNSGQCSLDGWSQPTGRACNDSLTFGAGSCGPSAGAKDCCDDFSKICAAEPGGGFALYQDKASGCGGHNEQWRLERTFDLTGLTQVRVCFDVKHEGTDDKDGLMLLAESGSDSQVLYCFQGGAEAGPPGVWQQVCSAPLDSWAENNPAVTLRFIAHSESDNHRVYLDNVRVWAYGGGCRPTGVTFTESFVGASPGTCSSGDWTVVDPSGGLKCNSFSCMNRSGWEPGLEVDQAVVNLSKHFDLSAFDGFLAVCLGLGWEGTDSSDYVTLRLDSGGGPNTLLQVTGPFGTDQYCREFCAYLGRRLMPEVANNPDVLLEVVLGSTSGKLELFWLEIRGERFCPAGQAVLGEPVGDGLGNYDFSLTSPQVLQARLRCDWLGGAPRSGYWVVFR